VLALLVCDPIQRQYTIWRLRWGKNKKNKQIQTTSNMSDDDTTKGKEDHTDPFNPKNINHPTSIDELPDELPRRLRLN